MKNRKIDGENPLVWSIRNKRYEEEGFKNIVRQRLKTGAENIDLESSVINDDLLSSVNKVLLAEAHAAIPLQDKKSGPALTESSANYKQEIDKIPKDQRKLVMHVIERTFPGSNILSLNSGKLSGSSHLKKLFIKLFPTPLSSRKQGERKRTHKIWYLEARTGQEC